MEQPSIAHGGKAVAEMGHSGARFQAFRNAMTGADDDVGILRNLEPFDGTGKKGQEIPIVPFNSGNGLEPGGLDGMGVDGFRNRPRIMEQCKNRGLGKGFTEQFQNPFAAPHSGKPVVTEHNLQILPGGGK